MTGYSCGAGGVMFVQEKIDRAKAAAKMKKVAMRRSNDNINGHQKEGYTQTFPKCDDMPETH
nr:hypothetical protein [Cytophagales bacterium]